MSESTTESRIGKPVLVNMAEVEAEPIRWLWPGRIPLGKLTLLAGDPGLGKSLVTIDVVARVTCGRAWPDGSGTPEVGGVLLLSAEDDPSDTIRPRLDAARADPSRVMLLEGVGRYESEKRCQTTATFNLARDNFALKEAITKIQDCRLVVIDPISAYLGDTDSHKNADVRAVLAPLADLARREQVAVLAVTHLNKGSGAAVYRSMGSLAFVAAPRAV